MSKKYAAERRDEIVKLVARRGTADVNELSDILNVSKVTIRSDLKILDQCGLLLRTHGGVIATDRVLTELSLPEKEISHIKIKHRIAIATCDLIADGDMVILDSGSTTAEIAKICRRFNDLTVMTNGLNIARILSETDGIEVMMTGGTLRKKSQSFFGRVAEESLAQFHFDKLILGVDGFDMQAGITTHFEPESHLNRKMCEAARQVIVVTDSSKFNRTCLHKICDVEKIDILVTDRNIPLNFTQELKNRGVKVIEIETD